MLGYVSYVPRIDPQEIQRYRGTQTSLEDGEQLELGELVSQNLKFCSGADREVGSVGVGQI